MKKLTPSQQVFASSLKYPMKQIVGDISPPMWKTQTNEGARARVMHSCPAVFAMFKNFFVL
jgi:hypothetical protein